MHDTPDETRGGLPEVSATTEESLQRFAPIYAEDYEDFKTELLSWLTRRGKKPFKDIGYAYETVKTTHYKIERAYRWKWRETGEYTTTFTPDEAERFIDHLVQKTPLEDREVRDYIKALKRLFRWFNETQGKNYDWSYSKKGQLNKRGTSNRRHYFEQHELKTLYEAAIDESSMPHYNSVSGEERDRLKRHLAQRLTKPKNEIGAEEFKQANSWKFPSLMAMSIDLGLRPVEVGRASTGWLRLSDEKVVIPRNEASKGNDPWECVLSSRSVSALQRWLDERYGYEKYADTDSLWLTKYGNPYGSKSLNDLLNRLLERTQIRPRNRKLSWYAIRRGAATMWANNSGLEQASEQLRHKKLETTRRYIKSGTESRKSIATDNW